MENHVLRSIGSLFGYVEDIMSTLEISRVSLEFMTLHLLNVTTLLGPKNAEATAGAAAVIRDEAAKEVGRNFPLLHSQSAVALWGALEACLDDFCADWLVEYPAALKSDALSNIRVPVAVLHGEDPKAMMDAVVDEIASKVAAKMKPGIGRFKEVLSTIGLKVDARPPLERDLLELSKVRHLIVHRHGVVDQKFVRECGWLKATVGTRHILTDADLTRYANAVRQYGELVQQSALNKIDAWLADAEKLKKPIEGGALPAVQT